MPLELPRFLRNDIDRLYDEAWAAGPRRKRPWANAFCEIICELFNPRSIIDLGCGTADLLSAFKERQIRVLGIDGSRAAERHTCVDPEEFLRWDLRRPLQSGKRYDLCLCLEVAEHLPEEKSKVLLQSIARSSSTVIFTAAVPEQGAPGLVHLKYPHWWRERFEELEYYADAAATAELKELLAEIPDIGEFRSAVDNLQVFYRGPAPRPVISSPGNNQHLYFTGPSISADGECLVHIETKDGSPNIALTDLSTSERRVLTENTRGDLKSYPYFTGEEAGLSKSSIALDPVARAVYYILDGRLERAGFDGKRTPLADIPLEYLNGYSALSPDGAVICLTLFPRRAVEGPLRNGKPAHSIDRRCKDENLASRLCGICTTSGKILFDEPVPRAWVTHVQFAPGNSRVVLYNHEWTEKPGVDRIWIWDGQSHRRLRTLADGRAAEDWISHEIWADERTVIYHGRRKDGRNILGRADSETNEIIEIPFPPHYRGYGHFAALAPNLTVSDGYYADAKFADGSRGNEWLSAQAIDWEKRQIRWFPLVRHLSSFNGQDTHPHPIFSPSGKEIYFTASRGTATAVYRADLPAAVLEEAAK